MNQQIHSGSGDNIHAERDVVIHESQKIMSDLTTVLSELSKKMFIDSQSESDVQQKIVISPEVKILYNNVQRFKPIIDNYKLFIGKLNALYNQYDLQGTNKTHLILENITIKYLNAKELLKQKYPCMKEIELVRKHSDDLICAVEESLVEEIKKSSNLEISIEAINVAIQVVLIDAFIRCKILERPPEDAFTK
jgi:hypothetical protein